MLNNKKRHSSGPYTAKEEDIIRKHVSKNPGNLTLAFEDASNELGGTRLPTAISGHWYQILKHQTDKPSMVVATRHQLLLNGKAQRRPAVVDEEGISIVDIVEEHAPRMKRADKMHLINVLMGTYKK